MGIALSRPVKGADAAVVTLDPGCGGSGSDHGHKSNMVNQHRYHLNQKNEPELHQLQQRPALQPGLLF